MLQTDIQQSLKANFCQAENELDKIEEGYTCYVSLCTLAKCVAWLVGWLWASRQKIYTITVGSLAGLGNEAILTQQCGK